MRGSGDDEGAFALLLYDTDYLYDDQVGAAREETTVTAENKLARDVVLSRARTNRGLALTLAPSVLSDAKKLIGAAATTALMGIALSLNGNGGAGVGGWIAVVGLLALMYGLHRFGRQGPEPAPKPKRRARRTR